MVLKDFNEKIQDPRLSILKVMHEVVFCLISPFEKLRMSSKNQIVKSPFEKDYNLCHTLYPFKKGLCSPSVLFAKD